jgi:hypothetical protein
VLVTSDSLLNYLTMLFRLNTLHSVKQDGKMAKNGEYARLRIWKEAVMTYFKFIVGEFSLDLVNCLSYIM